MNVKEEIIMKMSNGEYLATYEVDVWGMEVTTVTDFTQAARYPTEDRARNVLNLITKGKIPTDFDDDNVSFVKFEKIETRLID